VVNAEERAALKREVDRRTREKLRARAAVDREIKAAWRRETPAPPPPAPKPRRAARPAKPRAPAQHAAPETAYERELAANRARKELYRGACVDCGAPTTGCNGPGKAPERCHLCSRKMRRAWTHERIVAAIRGFAAEHGRPPLCREWLRKGDDHPTVTTVQDRFGSWSAGVEAAGFPRPVSGKYERTPQIRRQLSEFHRARYAA
jgi:hypothetical protein